MCPMPLIPAWWGAMGENTLCSGDKNLI